MRSRWLVIGPCSGQLTWSIFKGRGPSSGLGSLTRFPGHLIWTTIRPGGGSLGDAVPGNRSGGDACLGPSGRGTPPVSVDTAPPTRRNPLNLARYANRSDCRSEGPVGKSPSVPLRLCLCVKAVCTSVSGVKSVGCHPRGSAGRGSLAGLWVALR